MRHIRPLSLDEMDNLEDEVMNELDGVETSFTTQRKIYQFLVRDYEDVNASLQRELLAYRENISTYQKKINNRFVELEKDVECLRNDLSNENRENEQLHELVAFLGNQLNGRASVNSSSSRSSVSEVDSSVFLDDIIEDIHQNPTIESNNSNIEKTYHVPVPSSINKRSEDPVFDEVVETLTENIELKDQLLERLEIEIEDQAEYIKLLLKQQYMYHDESQKDKVKDNFCDRGLYLHDEIFPPRSLSTSYESKRIRQQQQRQQQEEEEKRIRQLQLQRLNQQIYQQLSAQLQEQEQLQQQDNSTGRFATWENHSSKFGRKLFSKWGYTGGGLGKDGNGIVSPIKAAPIVRTPPADERWPEDTTLIIGDSMINNIEEDRLRRYNAKVVPCPGASIKDMYKHVTPLPKKEPSQVIVHVGTNDAPFKPSEDIVKDLLLLRTCIKNNLPAGSKVIISTPIMRSDNKLANSRIREVNFAFKYIPNVILNDKLDGSCLGKKGLHLNQRGSGKLASNFITQMQCV